MERCVATTVQGGEQYQASFRLLTNNLCWSVMSPEAANVEMKMGFTRKGSVLRVRKPSNVPKQSSNSHLCVFHGCFPQTVNNRMLEEPVQLLVILGYSYQKLPQSMMHSFAGGTPDTMIRRPPGTGACEGFGFELLLFDNVGL